MSEVKRCVFLCRHAIDSTIRSAEYDEGVALGAPFLERFKETIENLVAMF